MESATPRNVVYCSTYTKAEEVPVFCSGILHVLAEASDRNQRAVEVGLFEDTRICQIFCENIYRFIDSDSGKWRVYVFKNFHDSKGIWYENGLEMKFFSGTTIQRKEILKNLFKNVLNELRIGWEKVDPSRYPEIGHTKDPCDYSLYMKTTDLDEEDTLIRLLASRLSLGEEQIYCDRFWKRAPHFRKEMYLWIQNSSHDEVVEKIGFTFYNLQLSDVLYQLSSCEAAPLL